MSKLKETEALLLTAAKLLVQIRKLPASTKPKDLPGALISLSASPEFKSVVAWVRDRRKALKDVDTVKAKVVTTAVVEKEGKKARMNRHDKEHKIVAAVATSAAKRALASMDEEFGSLSAKEAGKAAKKRSTGKDGVKAKASTLTEISDVVNPKKKVRVPFVEKVKVEIANRVDAGAISKKLMRQAHAYVDKHSKKVENMSEYHKVKAAADKVLKLTVKANTAE